MSTNGIHRIDAAFVTKAQSNKINPSKEFGAVLRKASGNHLDNVFEAASQRYGVSVDLLKAVAQAESNFCADVTSHCGAMGIMQLMPATAKALGVQDAYNPEQNIMGGAKYLRQLLKEFEGNSELALAAYNAGPGNVKKYHGIPPFAETQNYVEKVMQLSGDSAVRSGSVCTFHEQVGSGSVIKKQPEDAVSSAFRMYVYEVQMQMLETNESENTI